LARFVARESIDAPSARRPSSSAFSTSTDLRKSKSDRSDDAMATDTSSGRRTSRENRAVEFTRRERGAALSETCATLRFRGEDGLFFSSQASSRSLAGCERVRRALVYVR